MSLCFFIKDYQDLDHFAPVINYLKGDKIFIYLENKELIKDKRLIFLKKFAEIKIINKQNKIIQRFKNYVFRFYLLEKTMFFLIKVLSSIKILSFFFKNNFFVKNNINVLIYDHRSPENCRYIFLSKFLNIKIISMPHGYHIFTDQIEFEESQKSRNIFDYYITQNDLQKKKLISLDINQNKLITMGSPRFTDDWIQELKRIYNKNNILFKNDNLILSIFLGHWKYGINRENTIKLLKDIIILKNYNIILNLHTRGSSKLEINEINEIKKNNNIIINNTEYHASEIVEISNIIIGVGTSVLLECITKGKKFYYLSYLQKYQTIFKDLYKHQLPESNAEVIEILKKFKNNKDSFVNKSSNFYFRYIKNNIKSLQDTHKNFFRELN